MISSLNRRRNGALVGWLVSTWVPFVALAQMCPGDLNGDGQVTVDEVVRSVDAALNGCGPAPTPTAPPQCATRFCGKCSP